MLFLSSILSISIHCGFLPLCPANMKLGWLELAGLTALSVVNAQVRDYSSYPLDFLYYMEY